MSSITFDTLKYSKRLQELGFTREQAEGFAEMQHELVSGYDEAARKELATKADLFAIRSELKEEIANTKHEILKWMIATMVAQTALIVAVIAFLK